MESSRHRREVSRRTVVIGSVLAGCLALGVVGIGLGQGNGLRLAMMWVLGVAVAAGLLALDEARVVEARLNADLSRERAGRSRDATAQAAELRALVGRIDQLDDEVASLRRELRRPPRSIVIVAQGARSGLARPSRILEIADVVPAVRSVFAAPEPAAPTSTTTMDPTPGPMLAPQEPGAEVPDVIDVRESVAASLRDGVSAGAAATDDEIALDVDDFPVIEVIGEFSLEGLALFPRPAGMPTAFPSVEASAARDEQVRAADAEPAAGPVIDLRERQRSHRSA